MLIRHFPDFENSRTLSLTACWMLVLEKCLKTHPNYHLWLKNYFFEKSFDRINAKASWLIFQRWCRVQLLPVFGFVCRNTGCCHSAASTAVIGVDADFTNFIHLLMRPCVYPRGLERLCGLTLSLGQRLVAFPAIFLRNSGVIRHFSLLLPSYSFRMSFVYPW